ncbi:TPA: EscR/YscR/HrcR family type III secretion system export apparatus protein [Vibrio vulnificus]|nr:EscR/YscR/HrcR family type III secretion system export apparatus protein [Vibrio vulnificus]
MPNIDFSNPIFESFFYITISAFIPFLLVSVTCFTRYIIVLSLLRTALGLQQTPPNIVIISICLFMTFFSMAPTVYDIKEVSYDLYQKGTITQLEAIDKGLNELNKFLISKTEEKDYYFVKSLQDDSISEISENSYKLITLVPAFILSELKVAFQFAFIIFLPFLLIDLIVASILMALGMIMLPPISISLPIKLLIFVLIDGWTLIVGSLISGFQS